MTITFVKKILQNGLACPKCADVQEKLDASGQMELIDNTIIADERDPESEGMVLAKKLNVERAPFFVVERDGQAPEVYTVYLKFAKEVLAQKTDEKEELKEIMSNNQDLDFL